ncbi:hypothetical protein JNW93_15325, partial [Lacticaseibacillus rhamnosus]|uniref:hypothetical protein n=1 Tax=Lacticaseibacillus rhamnosus TaxID=47715 RepID=UPI0019515DF2
QPRACQGTDEGQTETEMRRTNMKRLLTFLLSLMASSLAFGQLTIGGNVDGNGNITYTGSNMTGHLYGNGNFYINGLTPFNISNPTNGQCLTYS